jgi:hypothetical protein
LGSAFILPIDIGRRRIAPVLMPVQLLRLRTVFFQLNHEGDADRQKAKPADDCVAKRPAWT